MTTQDSFRVFEQICLNALTRREYSRYELASKASENTPVEIVDAVLDKLAENNWQSDARFCESFVRAKVGKGDGHLKIYQALKQRGIADALIQEALGNIDWIEMAEHVYQRKYRGAPVVNLNERSKRQRFMAQRGFSFEEINTVMKSG